MKNAITFSAVGILVLAGLGISLLMYSNSLAPTDSAAAGLGLTLELTSPSSASAIAKDGEVIISLKSSSTQGVSAAELAFEFDEKILQGISISENANLLGLNKNVDNTSGKVTVDITTSGPGNFPENASLIDLKFKVLDDQSDTTISLLAESNYGIPNALTSGNYPALTLALADQVSPPEPPPVNPEPTPTPTPSPTPEPPSTPGDGLKAIYYDNSDFTQPKLVKVDPTINFNWRNGAPKSSIGNDTFSVVWTGFIVPQKSANYTFTAEVDDGIRLYVDDELVIDRWKDQNTKVSSSLVALTAGKMVPIKVEYYENRGRAQIKLYWQATGFKKEIVPQYVLYSE